MLHLYDCIPHYLSKILSYVEKSQEVIDDMATKLLLLEHKLDQTNSEINSQHHENEDLARQVPSQATIIDSLRNENKKLQDALTKIKSTSSRVPSPITSKPTLMIGSSVLNRH